MFFFSLLYVACIVSLCVFNVLSVCSALQTQLSPWVWYSSWYLFCAHHTRLSMNMCSAPSAGKKHCRPFFISQTSDINSWFTLIIALFFFLSDIWLVWWRTVHRVSRTAGILLWVWRSYSDSGQESYKEKKRVRYVPSLNLMQKPGSSIFGIKNSNLVFLC